MKVEKKELYPGSQNLFGEIFIDTSYIIYLPSACTNLLKGRQIRLNGDMTKKILRDGVKEKLGNCYVFIFLTFNFVLLIY